MVDSDLMEEPVLVTTSVDKMVRIWGMVGNFQGSLLHGPVLVRLRLDAVAVSWRSQLVVDVVVVLNASVRCGCIRLLVVS